MHKRYNSRSELYHVCASVYIHFCMQRKNNENIPHNLNTNKKYICKENAFNFYFEKFIATSWECCNVARMYP